jgi:transcriptional repressor NF-X1
MPAPNRSFLHALAEDFGLDSESQDPEPHRHVVIFKTPRFVSAPMKTLGQCAKIKPATTTVVGTSVPKSTGSKEPWNGFLLSHPKFGLTIEELHADLKEEFAKAELEFTVEFLPSEDVVLHALSTSSSWLQKLDQTLSTLKPAVVKKVLGLKLAGSVGLCAVDGSGNVLRKEDEGNGAGGGGWSQIAKGTARKVVVEERGVGGKGGFAVLGVKKENKKAKEKVPEEAVEDWEKEVEGWGDV